MKPTYISLYCVKCKRKTETRDLLNVRSKNNRPMLRGICTECCTTNTVCQRCKRRRSSRVAKFSHKEYQAAVG